MKPHHRIFASLMFWLICGPIPLAFAQVGSVAQPAPTVVVTVPFVGCASDGQMGPLAAPTGQSPTISVPATMAARLAYYEADDAPGVLAPRGWHCFSTYGSNGASLFVSPDPIDSKMLLSHDWKGFSGQAVQISVYDGATSGRFELAKVIARVFPAYKQFVNSVIAEGIEPASDFPLGPFPRDKLARRAKNIVEFETPANTAGLGTTSRLQPSASPIDGVAIVVEGEPGLILLSARLPGNDRDLVSVVVKQVETEATPRAQE